MSTRSAGRGESSTGTRGRWLRRAMVVSLALSATACGGLRIAYEHADTALLFWIDRTFDLDKTQAAQARVASSRLVAWHRRSELPGYVEELKRVQTAVAQGRLAEGEIERFMDSAQRAFERVIDAAAPELAPTLASLRPEQIARLQRKFDKANEEFRRDWVDARPERQRDRRFERAREEFERWFGRLNSDQVARLRTWADTHPTDGDARLIERVRRQREFLALIAETQARRPTEADAITLARTYYRRMQSREGDGARDAERARAVALIADVTSLAKADQRALASERLQRWIDEFRSLSERHG